MTADAQIHGFQTRPLLAFNLFLIGWPALGGRDFGGPAVGWPCGPDCAEPNCGGAIGGLDCGGAMCGGAPVGPDCDEADTWSNCWARMWWSRLWWARL